ncbi:Protein of unknown function [Pyronema omphalodes CBS 100304]|uniref:Uncharacterized protein n=1 Tax=Pyronema omphalodes (strain CBS 100304) TaxID=1076935 RepID=U4LMR9_PYROM|nr:Protein of unknown function [Pyronema omphalodes CBS 100304]
MAISGISDTTTAEAGTAGVAPNTPGAMATAGKKEMNPRWLLNSRMGVDPTDRRAVQARRNEERVECERLELPLDKAFYKWNKSTWHFLVKTIHPRFERKYGCDQDILEDVMKSVCTDTFRNCRQKAKKLDGGNGATVPAGTAPTPILGTETVKVPKKVHETATTKFISLRRPCKASSLNGTPANTAVMGLVPERQAQPANQNVDDSNISEFQVTTADNDDVADLIPAPTSFPEDVSGFFNPPETENVSGSTPPTPSLNDNFPESGLSAPEIIAMVPILQTTKIRAQPARERKAVSVSNASESPLIHKTSTDLLLDRSQVAEVAENLTSNETRAVRTSGRMRKPTRKY